MLCGGTFWFREKPTKHLKMTLKRRSEITSGNKKSTSVLRRFTSTNGI